MNFVILNYFLIIAYSQIFKDNLVVKKYLSLNFTIYSS